MNITLLMVINANNDGLTANKDDILKWFITVHDSLARRNPPLSWGFSKWVSRKPLKNNCLHEPSFPSFPSSHPPYFPHVSILFFFTLFSLTSPCFCFVFIHFLLIPPTLSLLFFYLTFYSPFCHPLSILPLHSSLSPYLSVLPLPSFLFPFPLSPYPLPLKSPPPPPPNGETVDHAIKFNTNSH